MWQARLSRCGRGRAGRTIAWTRAVMGVSATVRRVRVPEMFPRERVVLGELHLLRIRLDGLLDERWNHILSRHGPESTANDASKFGEQTNSADVIKETLNNPTHEGPSTTKPRNRV